MDVSIATFNLNNLFGRWNLYVDAPAPPPSGAPSPSVEGASTTSAATSLDQPRTKGWTHRYRAQGRTDYELFDQIWLSGDLAAKQTEAWIQRRTSRRGDAPDHDPAAVRLDL